MQVRLRRWAGFGHGQEENMDSLGEATAAQCTQLETTTGTKQVRTRKTVRGSISKRCTFETIRHLLRVEGEARCQSAITPLSRADGLLRNGAHIGCNRDGLKLWRKEQTTSTQNATYSLSYLNSNIANLVKEKFDDVVAGVLRRLRCLDRLPYRRGASHLMPQHLQPLPLVGSHLECRGVSVRKSGAEAYVMD